MATITQRKDGRYEATLSVCGNRHHVYGKSRSEAKAKLAALQRQLLISGTLPNPGTRTVSDLITAWLDAVSTDLKPKTLADYRDTQRLHVLPTLGHLRLSKLDPAHLQRLYVKLADNPRVAQKVHRQLHRALRLAVVWGWLTANPADRVLAPRYQSGQRQLWSTDELSAFLIGSEGHWQHPLWVFLAGTGCRLGEALALTWPDVDLAAGAAHIDRTVSRIGCSWSVTAPKTRAGQRTVTLPATVLAALRRQRAQTARWQLAASSWSDLGLVFPAPTNGGYLFQTVVLHGLERECKRLAVPIISPHSFRHLHATLLLGHGAPIPEVAKRLGHTNSAVTMTVYAHALEKEDREAANVIQRAMMGSDRRP